MGSAVGSRASRRVNLEGRGRSDCGAVGAFQYAAERGGGGVEIRKDGGGGRVRVRG